MKRIAILIGSPGTPYLTGVEKDMTNMKTFLKSANGGGWTIDEIKESKLNPSAQETFLLLDTINNCDFALVYYSGHGFTGIDNKGKININNYEVINISDIANRCKKQITIIDACRGYQDFVGIDGISSEEAVIFDSINPEGSKAVFNEYLKYCKNGRVLLYASQKGENAQDTVSGGLFSTNILKSTKFLIDISPNPIINVNTVFKQAKELTKHNHTPQIEFTNNESLNFPFAIKPRKIEKRFIKKSASDNTGIILGSVAVGLGIAILVGALISDNKKK